MARWLIQCGGSDVTGKIKMDIISGEEDGDVEGVHREVWDKEVSVYSVWVWQTSSGMGFREDLLCQLVIIFHRMSLGEGREHSVALFWDRYYPQHQHVQTIFPHLESENLVASTCAEWCPPGPPTVCLAGMRGRRGRRDVLWIRSSAEKGVTGGFVNPHY